MAKDNNNEFNKLHLGDTHIPDIFLMQYSQSLSNDALLLYLWLNMTGQTEEFTKASLKKYGLLPDSAIDEALADLMYHDLITEKKGAYRCYDLKEREVEEYYKYLKARGDRMEPTGLNSDEQAREILAQSISNTFYQGFLPYIFYRLIDKCLYEYGFEGQVVYKLFEEGFESKTHRSLLLMEKLAKNWHDKGYTDVFELEKMLDNNKRINEIMTLVGKMLRKRINELDMERFTRWVEDYDMSAKMVELAIRRNDYREKLTPATIENTLKKWFDNGIKTVEAAEKFDDTEHKENKRKAARRKGKTANSSGWRTGEEAGITLDSDEDKKPEKNEAEEPDDILNMFDDDEKTEPEKADATASEKVDPVMAIALKMFGENNEDDT